MDIRDDHGNHWVPLFEFCELYHMPEDYVLRYIKRNRLQNELRTTLNEMCWFHRSPTFYLLKYGVAYYWVTSL